MKKIIFLIIILISVAFIYIYSSKSDESIKIGFVAGLTGKYSSLGKGVLSGYELALNEYNETAIKKIKLVIKDDKQTEYINKEIINSFIKDDIKLILGNATSSMTKNSLELLKNNKEILLFSSSASSADFSKKDDNFIRTQVSITPFKYDAITKYLIKKKKTKILVIYDSLNESYSKSVMKQFRSSFLEKGGEEFVKVLKFSVDFTKILDDIKQTKPEVVFFITNSIDTAKLIQYIKLNNINPIIFSSGWAFSQDFINDSGKASQDVLFVSNYNLNSKNISYIKFRDKYKRIYKKDPSSKSLQAYETMKIVINAYKNKKDQSIKDYILKKSKFEGLQSNIIFDKYGDIKREYLLFKIDNLEIKRVR